jgi:glycine reductase complex component B subunit gamma
MMSERFKVVYYVNQFFGQIGGEDKASMEPEVHEGTIGPALGFNGLIKDSGDVVATIICGDNYFNEHKADALEKITGIIKKHNPDIFVAGPAFNAGRYGMACGEIGKYVFEQFKIPVVTGMYKENPGIDVCRHQAIIVETGDSAASMRKALPVMAKIVTKLIKGEELGSPAEEGYIPQGTHKTVIVDKRGSQRAVDMMLARLKGQEFETEMPMPVFDRVDPAPAVKDIRKATIALVTSGGIVPVLNPDHIESASATKFGKYDISGMDGLSPKEFKTIHGGYDPVYANDDPNRVAPLDILKQYEKDGKIGKVFENYYVTTGTGTAVANAVKFGVEIGAQLKAAGVDAVILTST